MRQPIRAATTLTSPAIILVALATPAAALDLPARKPGLWEIRMDLESRNIPAQVAQHCIDAETDKQMNALGGNMRQDMCEKQNVTRKGGTYVVDSVCKIAGTTTTSQAVVSGDLNSAYTVKIASKREGGPSIPGLPADGGSNMTIEAKWLGACQGDQKPGDMVMSGRKLNIRDMQSLQGLLGGTSGGRLPSIPGLTAPR